MNKATFAIVFLLFSCSGEQSKVLENKEPIIKKEQVIEQSKAEENTLKVIEQPKKKFVPEEELQEANFVHEGGDIQEFDEEGNPIE